MALKPMLLTGYTNHVDAVLHQNGKIAYVIVNKTVPAPDRKQSRDVHILELDVATLNITRKIKTYHEGTDMAGPAGYCSVSILPSGFLLVNLAISRVDNPDDIVWHTEILTQDIVGNPIAPPYNPATGVEALLYSIAYARTNPEQSALRALIREVIKAGK